MENIDSLPPLLPRLVEKKQALRLSVFLLLAQWPLL